MAFNPYNNSLVAGMVGPIDTNGASSTPVSVGGAMSATNQGTPSSCVLPSGATQQKIGRPDRLEVSMSYFAWGENLVRNH